MPEKCPVLPENARFCPVFARFLPGSLNAKGAKVSQSNAKILFC
jgi:hypothetical protein